MVMGVWAFCTNMLVYAVTRLYVVKTKTDLPLLQGVSLSIPQIYYQSLAMWFNEYDNNKKV